MAKAKIFYFTLQDEQTKEEKAISQKVLKAHEL